jgi:transposase
MFFVGIDWSEQHHDVCVLDELGAQRATLRIPEGVVGVARFHELATELGCPPAQLVIGIETDRGLLVHGLVAAGYTVFAINPLAVSRYRDRHTVSRAKSDPGDSKVLADLVRTDRQNHRAIAGDSAGVEGIKVLARGHQQLVWDRQRLVNRLRSSLREFYPAALAAFGTELAHPDAVAILERAPTPEQGRRLYRTAIEATLRRAGRQRLLARRAEQIQGALREPHLELPAPLSVAYGATVKATVGQLRQLMAQTVELELELREAFEAHQDAAILGSLPGLGRVLGARILGEFGDDRTRYESAKARKNAAGTSPITRASGKRRMVAARSARNHRSADACFQWTFSSLQHSPGAHAYYLAHRSRGHSHFRALYALANRWVGILHGCLASGTTYEEGVGWPSRSETLIQDTGS